MIVAFRKVHERDRCWNRYEVKKMPPSGLGGRLCCVDVVGQLNLARDDSE